jgi:anti-anti-sigma factor
MKIEAQGETLRVYDVKELGAANAGAFRHEVRAAMRDEVNSVDIDLSETQYLDSCGIGALISLKKTSQSKNGLFRLVYLRP